VQTRNRYGRAARRAARTRATEVDHDDGVALRRGRRTCALASTARNLGQEQVATANHFHELLLLKNDGKSRGERAVQIFIEMQAI
jgi:hypothetical protein